MGYEAEETFQGLHHVQLEKPPELAARGGCWFRGGELGIHLGVENDFRLQAKLIQACA